MAKPILLTEAGLNKIKDELEYLKTTGRQDMAEKIKTARGFGDLSENSEYDEAKNDQAKMEARIQEIEAMLKNFELINENDMGSSIGIGSIVKFFDEEFKEELTYKIVGAAEADPMNGKISDESPVGKALMNHEAGDEVIAETPQGNLKFKILDVTR